jgi:hypothetical protein
LWGIETDYVRIGTIKKAKPLSRRAVGYFIEWKRLDEEIR